MVESLSSICRRGVGNHRSFESRLDRAPSFRFEATREERGVIVEQERERERAKERDRKRMLNGGSDRVVRSPRANDESRRPKVEILLVSLALM